MPDPDPHPARRLDVLGLVVAGLVNSVLAPADAALLLAPGTPAQGGDLAARMAWIAAHTGQWQTGWAFWCVVTLTFAWSYYALARHLAGPRQWRDLAVGLALPAAAVDLAGVVINLAVLPQQAALGQGTASTARESIALTYLGFETLANALTNVTAFGLYSVAGLLLVPALFATPTYPRPLAWLGAAEWASAALATALLTVAPATATGPLLISFLLYAPWVWGGAWWIARSRAA